MKQRLIALFLLLLSPFSAMGTQQTAVHVQAEFLDGIMAALQVTALTCCMLSACCSSALACRMMSTEECKNSIAIRSALEREENETAQRLAYTIKGVTATIGANNLELKVRVLESAINSGQMDNVDELMGQLAVAMAPILKGLSALLSSVSEDISGEAALPCTPRRDHPIA